MERLDERCMCLHCVNIVMDVFPKILEKVMEDSKFPAKSLFDKIMKDNNFKKKMVQSDYHTIQTLSTGGYTKLDLTIIFKIITHFSNIFVTPPTRGWRSDPQFNELTIGDDAQRLRIIRNHFFHKVKTELTEAEYKEFLEKVEDICGRVDVYLSLSVSESLTALLKSYIVPPWHRLQEIEKIYTEEKSLKAFLVIETEKRKFTVYQTGSMRELLQELKERSDKLEEMEPITLTFPEVTDQEIVRQIEEELKEEINSGLVNIKLKHATKGSLILEIMVKRMVLLDDDKFKKELKDLLYRVLNEKKLKDLFKAPDIVVSEYYGFSERDDNEDLYDARSNKGGLRLHLEVKSAILNSQEAFQGEIQHLLETVESKTNGSQIFKSNPITAIMEPDSQSQPEAGICGLCHQHKRSSLPTVWCQDCDQLLCHSCEENHKTSEVTKDHNVIPHEDYQKLPPFILKTKLYCSKHHKKLMEFCYSHDEPICLKCKKMFHHECKRVSRIDKIAKYIKESPLFEDIITEIKNVCEKLKKIDKDQNDNLKQLQTTCDKIKESLEKEIDSMINHLIKMKEKTLSEIVSEYNELANDISSTSKLAQSKEKELNAILDQKDAIQIHASNQQIFLAIKEINKIVLETRNTIRRLVQNEKLHHRQITFDLNKTLKEIVEGIQPWGERKSTRRQSSVTIHTSGPTNAQKAVQSKGPVQLHLQQRINIESKLWYYGCCTLPSGVMVLAESCNIWDRDCKLSILNTDGSCRSFVQFKESEGICDVKPVDDYHVAVAHPKSLSLSIVNVQTETIVKTLNMGEQVFGLCCRDREIVCCVHGKGLVSVNIDSGNVKTVFRDKNVSYYSCYSHVAISDNILCYTCPETHKVTVLDNQYKVVLTYSNEMVLKSPSGVTIDDDNNIYVTGAYSNNLVMLSSNGDTCHQLLGKDDGLWYPIAVQYDSSTRKLVIINWDGGQLLCFQLSK